mmetsp:Transcript_143336/g.458093  ORF Transcript_143336/g.458093 Transcript_143336/m.458093 type:complete len:315 (+) Transcript_143336:666-1610(+)
MAGRPLIATGSADLGGLLLQVGWRPGRLRRGQAAVPGAPAAGVGAERPSGWRRLAPQHVARASVPRPGEPFPGPPAAALVARCWPQPCGPEAIAGWAGPREGPRGDVVGVPQLVGSSAASAGHLSGVAARIALRHPRLAPLDVRRFHADGRRGRPLQNERARPGSYRIQRRGPCCSWRGESAVAVAQRRPDAALQRLDAAGAASGERACSQIPGGRRVAAALATTQHGRRLSRSSRRGLRRLQSAGRLRAAAAAAAAASAAAERWLPAASAPGSIHARRKPAATVSAAGAHDEWQPPTASCNREADDCTGALPA